MLTEFTESEDLPKADSWGCCFKSLRWPDSSLECWIPSLQWRVWRTEDSFVQGL